MSNRRPEELIERLQPVAAPKSPSEALEPARPVARPKSKAPRKKARRLSPGLRWLNTMLTVLVAGLVFTAATVFWIGSEVNKAGPLREAKIESVRKGEGARDLAARLETNGIIGNQYLFVLNHMGRSVLSRFGGKPLSIKAGEFEFPAGASLKAVAEILNEGRSTMYRVTVPEGLTTQAIVNRLRADPNLQGDIAVMPGEGTLLPV
jgi:UPF0755 protein